MPTSTLSQKDTIDRPARFGGRTGKAFARLILVIVAVWLVMLLLVSGIYVNDLIHPPCLGSATQAAGFDSVDLVTDSGIALRGWWRAPRNGAVVVLLGGHGASRDEMLPEAELLSKHGYGVLTLDYRNCAGRAATLGAHETEELQAGLDFALSQDEVRQVAVLGFSAGGVAAIRGAAVNDRVRAVIAMGNYANMWDEIANSNAPPFSLEWQIERIVAGMIWAANGVSPAAVSPIDDLPRIHPRPVLLIHGEEEAEVTHAQAQFDATGQPKELWVVLGCGHGGYLEQESQEFERRVTDFLARALAP